MPAETVPLGVEFLQVAVRLGGQLGAAGAILDDIGDRLAAMEEQLLAKRRQFDRRRHVTERQQRAERSALPIFGMGENLDRVFFTFRPERAIRGHAVGVDDLAVGDVDDRIGDETGAAARQVLQRDHRCRRDEIVLARADEALVAQLVEPQARVGMDMPAVESAEAVDRDRIGAVLLEDRLLAEIHGRRSLQGLA